MTRIKRYLIGKGEYLPTRRSNVHYGGDIKDEVIEAVKPLLTESLIEAAKHGIVGAANVAKSGISAGVNFFKRKFGANRDEPSKFQKSEPIPMEISRKPEMLALPAPTEDEFENY